MEKTNRLAKSFEESRLHLKAVAYKMLGSTGEAEDAVQEAWIRLSRYESEEIENLEGWLTTVVARICLDTLRARKAKREEPLNMLDAHIQGEEAESPENDLLMANSIGPALLVVLDLLTPPERVAFVLHDLFDLSFKEIAPILDRTAEAARQLASRARRRIRGAGEPRQNADRQHEVVSAFFSASRDGNFEALIALLHPDVTLRADETAIKVSTANRSKGAPEFKPEISGAEEVAHTLKGKALGAQIALVDGHIGATWSHGNKPVIAFCFTLTDGKVSMINIVMDKIKLSQMDIKIIEQTHGSDS